MGTNLAISRRLGIAESDVEELKREYELAGDNEKVVLFRYGTSNYVCFPAASKMMMPEDYGVILPDVSAALSGSNFNGYVAQQTVYLNFDVISLDFTSTDATLSVPVVASPTDVIGELTPPLEESTDIPLWQIILGIVLLIVVLAVFGPILKPIFKLIIGIITFPFKLIGKLIDRGK